MKSIILHFVISADLLDDACFLSTKLTARFFKLKSKSVTATMKTTLKVVAICPPRFGTSIVGELPDDTVAGETEYMEIDDDSMAMSSDFDPG